MTILMIHFILCIAVGRVAENKGRSLLGFFLLSFFLSPIVGIICALLAAPDNAQLALREIAAGNMRTCPYCTEAVNAAAIICRYCRSELPAFEKPFVFSLESNVVSSESNSSSSLTKWDSVKALFWIVCAAAGLFFVGGGIGQKLMAQLF